MSATTTGAQATGTFAVDSAVVAEGDGRYRADLHERWSSLVGIHGGYSAGVVTRAIDAEVADASRPLRTLAVQFASAPRPGAAEVEVVVERAGRTMTTTTARLRQGGRVRLVAHAISSASWAGLAYDDVRRPPMPPPDLEDHELFVPPGGPGHFRNAEVRLDPRVVPFGGGDDAWLAAWLRPRRGDVVDAAWIVTVCDFLPPAVFSRTTGPVAAATLEYVVHLADGRPTLASGTHAYLDCRSPFSADGFAVEDGVLTDEAGAVLALSRQTRLAGMPMTFGD